MQLFQPVSVVPFDGAVVPSDWLRKNEMPEGLYYIGDPCYVLNPVWDDIITAMFNGTNSGHDGIYKIPRYGYVAIAGTAHGDGTYHTDSGSKLGVDAGCLSAVPISVVSYVNNITHEQAIEKAKEMGAVYSFTTSFLCSAEGGDIRFGDVHVDTRDTEDDYDEDNY